MPFRKVSLMTGMTGLSDRLSNPTNKLINNFYIAQQVQRRIQRSFERLVALFVCKLFSIFSFTGHFTQIVWKNTSEMGIAMAKRDGTCVVVACYYPRGNIVGQFIENVLKPAKSIY